MSLRTREFRSPETESIGFFFDEMKTDTNYCIFIFLVTCLLGLYTPFGSAIRLQHISEDIAGIPEPALRYLCGLSLSLLVSLTYFRFHIYLLAYPEVMKLVHIASGTGLGFFVFGESVILLHILVVINYLLYYSLIRSKPKLLQILTWCLNMGSLVLCYLILSTDSVLLSCILIF